MTNGRLEMYRVQSGDIQLMALMHYLVAILNGIGKKDEQSLFSKEVIVFVGYMRDVWSCNLAGLVLKMMWQDVKYLPQLRYKCLWRSLAVLQRNKSHLCETVNLRKQVAGAREVSKIV